MNRSMSMFVVLAAAAVVSAGPWVALAEAPAAAELKVIKTVAGGGEGGWDLLVADQEGKRAYVARGTRVMVFDIEQGKLVGEVTGITGAHGVALVPALNLGFVTCGKENSMAVFDLKTLKVTKTIKTGQNPDAILYDAATKKIFAFNGRSNDVTVVDPAALDAAPATLAVGGKPELGVSDGAGKIYVNLEDKSEVVQIDAKAMKVLAHWSLAPGEGPTGLAIDVAHHRLFAGCGNSKMIVLDADKGTVLADVPIGPGCDGVAFDVALGAAVSANGGNGTATVVREEPAGKFKAAQTVKTSKTLRTIDADSKTHQFYLPGNITGEDGKTAFGVMVIGAAK